MIAFVFEFDSDKSTANLAKHGIDFEAAQALWRDDRRLTLHSSRSKDEERWLMIGLIAEQGWTAIITYRDDVIRIISVRRARKEEMQLYGN